MSATISRPGKAGWRHRLFSGQPHQIIGSGERTYLRRWFLIPANRWCNIYWHRFEGSDEPVPHDHPWPFASIVLYGSYIEVSSDGRRKRRVPGRLAVRRATYRHYIVLEDDDGTQRPCTTLVITGPHRRDWGFWCAEDRFIPWQEFDASGCGPVRP